MTWIALSLPASYSPDHPTEIRMKLKEMTSAQWKSLKGDAEIKKAKWYQSGHSSVGKYIEKVNKARNDWQASKTDEIGPSARALKKYFMALSDLEKALKKFVSVKEFKETPEAQKLKTEIDGWLNEIQDKQVKLAKALAEAEKAAKTSMHGNDAKKMMDDFEKQFNF
jgi:Mg2+ and Co2+ transporter CorA